MGVEVTAVEPGQLIARDVDQEVVDAQPGGRGHQVLDGADPNPERPHRGGEMAIHHMLGIGRNQAALRQRVSADQGNDKRQCDSQNHTFQHHISSFSGNISRWRWVSEQDRHCAGCFGHGRGRTDFFAGDYALHHAGFVSPP